MLTKKHSSTTWKYEEVHAGLLMAVFHRHGTNVCRSLVCTVGQGTALQTMRVAVEYAALRGVYFSAFYRFQ